MLIQDGRLSISDHITHGLNGLESIEEAVEISLNTDYIDALGTAQIVLEE